MMKNINFCFYVAALAGLSVSANAQSQTHTHSTPHRTCSSHDVYVRQLQNPTFYQNRQEIEEHTARLIESGNVMVDRNVITIPVVVHVVYNTTAQNISDAQIQSQITALNNDYRKLNADASQVPSAFSALAADAEIQFCLAQRTPTGAATTGIVRKSTTLTSFIDDDKVKYSAQGGDDAWNSSQYLNLWVCNLGGGLLGYAQFPGGAAATDGVVINYTAFGTTGTAAAPYNKGRTATHEVGHWLNLYHIWGDDGTACTGSDQVTDTPNQADENYGCPTFSTNISCSNSGDMSMNYMDYTDDACMYMFTAGQKTRMRALFATGGARVGLTTSQGCVAPTTTTPSCGTATGLTAASITTTGATVSWTAVSGATSYTLQYKPTSSTTWTSVTGLTTTSRALTGLTSGTLYEFQVKATCGTTVGNFTTSATFTTTATTTGCTDAYETNETISAAKTISVNTNVTALIGTSTDVDYFKFTTTSTARNIRITLSTLPGDYDVYLYNSAGTQIGSSVNGSTTSETITYNTTTYGTFYVRVVGYSGASSSSVCYTLRAATSSTAFARLAHEETTPKEDVANEGIDVVPAGEAELRLYPNPVRYNLTVAYKALATQDVTISIYDALGRKVTSIVQNAYEGENAYQLNVETLTKGMYLLEVQDAKGSARKVEKFMIE